MMSEAQEETTRRDFVKSALGAVATVAVGGTVAFTGLAARRHRRRLVRFWHLLSGEWQAPTERVCDLFNQSQSQYEILPLLVPDTSADSKFLLGVAGGDPPD